MSSAASLVRSSLKSVLVATDFSETSRRALCHALVVARHYGAKFYLAHVVSGLGYTLVGPQALALASEAAEKELLQLEHDLLESGSLTASITNSLSAKVWCGKNCSQSSRTTRLIS
jgi:nucleotide-binding universal stress UspA family protein